MSTIKLADLVLDFEIYPRNDVSSTHVTALVDAFEAGEEIPPIIADAKSKRVVDGFHRVRMHDRLGHETVEVELRTYKNEAALFADAVRLNNQYFLHDSALQVLLWLQKPDLSDEQLLAWLDREIPRLETAAAGEGAPPASPAGTFSALEDRSDIDTPSKVAIKVTNESISPISKENSYRSWQTARASASAPISAYRPKR